MLLILLELRASACSYVYAPAAIVSPAEGTVPTRFVVRAGGRSYAQEPTIETPDGVRIEDIAEAGEDAWQVSLEPGEYSINGTRIMVSDEVDVPQPEAPGLILIEDDVQRVNEAYTAACMDYMYRRHLLRTIHVDVPAAEGTGWAVKITDDSDGHISWLGVDTVDTEQHITLDLGRVGQASEEACLTVSLHSPSGESVWEESYPCQAGASSAGCSATGGGASLLVAMLSLLGIRRRR
ncbi:MAG: MYXO-CTERM domain-containing protein [Myxococcota bacterium]|nr:MYXO-CTERM domain-containing protein [Myxococcota bacterium]